jgi:hypothetical protein
VSIKVIDRGYRKLLDTFAALGARKTVITVGVHEADGREPHEGAEFGETVLDIATANEFGTDTIPQRSFIRAWFDENRQKNAEAAKRLLQSVIQGKRTREDALNLLGQTFVGQVQRKIAQGIPPPNSPITVALKGSSKPLIDTGQLRTSITYAIDGKVKPSKAQAKRTKKQKRKNKKAVRSLKAKRRRKKS